MRFTINLLSLLLILSFPVLAQKLKSSDKNVINNLQAHTRYLADDKLEGRRAGTNGERLAKEYIKAQFEKNGLGPKGDSGTFYQAFQIWDGKSFEKSHLFINGQKISPGDFFPVPSSPEANIESSPSIALKEAGVPWFLDLKEDPHTAQNNPHVSIMNYLVNKAKDASKKGASALIVYNSDDEAEDQKYDGKERSEESPIPLIVVSNKIAKKYFSDQTATLQIKLSIDFTDITRTAHNVIGFINNLAATTAVIGAHYDHLGFGEDGNSLHGSGQKLIHNGADDNASGIAALIELSKLLKSSRLKKNNYLFIAFSGEELGLFGSKFYVENPTIDLSRINYMINMDMVGRLNDTTRTLTVGGYGTSPYWAQVLSHVSTQRHFVNKYDTSGAGPSDHSSFYRKNIPVLFFFTGWHKDYHKPTDDFDKLNYTGEYRILQYIYRVIEATNKTGKLAFTKTKEPQTGMARFSVTMGITPDYTFHGNGVRVDGVSDGRPAQKAGLKVGDVVIQLGEHSVSSIENYMEALSNFKAGDKTKVRVKRGDNMVEADVIF